MQTQALRGTGAGKQTVIDSRLCATEREGCCLGIFAVGRNGKIFEAKLAIGDWNVFELKGIQLHITIHITDTEVAGGILSDDIEAS
ncbi:hypothetical protein ISN72_00110 [Dyella nitratireducens]|nr:hypothetical protein [Dyella nitratireducens]GLQ44000.1 hypothetical protein GCM10007902_38500 [Dyella nitratireducens]